MAKWLTKRACENKGGWAIDKYRLVVKPFDSYKIYFNGVYLKKIPREAKVIVRDVIPGANLMP